MASELLKYCSTYSVLPVTLDIRPDKCTPLLVPPSNEMTINIKMELLFIVRVGYCEA